ncbi:tetratricopeptide repeat protein [Ancylobacter oerskovii]|uniref:Tetratricopeptide repeat protein n=1 Tax=Ancylobacter oerskovii TaxID=459519 RepID=A0ABW4YSG8_9HYPH|nr:tetratricopeptide repeat protein [Ancylobacter oerskovii]MBS7545198.1 sel1 repeat family protein [Ancylobacter oerskovii]
MRARHAALAAVAALALAAGPAHAQAPQQQQPAAAPAPDKNGPPLDAAYGAFQRGDYATALKLAVERANTAQDPVAMVLAGQILSQGYGVFEDKAAARQWYEAAASRGNADALFAIASLKLKEAGNNAQLKGEAVPQLREAAEKGSAPAAYNLGLLYLEGEAAPKDPAKAADWFRKAADKDEPDALYALAILYREGRGVPRDAIESARLLRRADEVGHVVATTEYAIAVFNGFGMPKDEERAATLFRKAALAGNAIAQNRYARMLSSGRGVGQDKPLAAAWYKVAQSQGGAKDAELDKLIASLTPQERQKAEAILRKWAGGPSG